MLGCGLHSGTEQLQYLAPKCIAGNRLQANLGVPPLENRGPWLEKEYKSLFAPPSLPLYAYGLFLGGEPTGAPVVLFELFERAACCVFILLFLKQRPLFFL